MEVMEPTNKQMMSLNCDSQNNSSAGHTDFKTMTIRDNDAKIKNAHNQVVLSSVFPANLCIGSFDMFYQGYYLNNCCY